MEHHSNIVPWHFLRERRGAVIKWAPVDDDGNFLLEEYEKLFTPAHQDGGDHPHVERARHGDAGRPRSCASPTPTACRCSSTGRRAPSTSPSTCEALDCDFFVFTGHKVYGPTGIGVLYGKKEWLERLPPYQGGGEMIRTVSQDAVTYNDPPHRFEAGTPAIVEAVGPRRGAGIHDGRRARQDRRARGGAARLCAGAPRRHEFRCA